MLKLKNPSGLTLLQRFLVEQIERIGKEIHERLREAGMVPAHRASMAGALVSELDRLRMILEVVNSHQSGRRLISERTRQNLLLAVKMPYHSLDSRTGEVVNLGFDPFHTTSKEELIGLLNNA